MSQAGQEGGSSPTLENMQYSSKRAASGRAKSSKAIHFFSSSPQLLSSRTAYSWIHTKIDSRHRSTFEFQFWYPTRLDIIKNPYLHLQFQFKRNTSRLNTTHEIQQHRRSSICPYPLLFLCTTEMQTEHPIMEYPMTITIHFSLRRPIVTHYCLLL